MLSSQRIRGGEKALSCIPPLVLTMLCHIRGEHGFLEFLPPSRLVTLLLLGFDCGSSNGGEIAACHKRKKGEIRYKTEEKKDALSINTFLSKKHAESDS